MADVYKAETLRISVNGVEIEYIKVGYGPEAMVFAPGASAVASMYHPLFSRLPLSLYTIYAFTPRGCGNSGHVGTFISLF